MHECCVDVICMQLIKCYNMCGLSVMFIALFLLATMHRRLETSVKMRIICLFAIHNMYGLLRAVHYLVYICRSAQKAGPFVKVHGIHIFTIHNRH